MANSHVTTGGAVVIGTGVVFLIDSFLPWHRTCIKFLGNSACGSHNGWQTPFSLLATLLVLALVAEVVAVQVLEQKLPAVGTLTWPQIRLGVAGVALALVLLQLIVGDSGLGRSYGLFLGIVLAAGLLYGTYLRNQESEPATAA
jgi:multidrug transporter EmrE-like cation transporter